MKHRILHIVILSLVFVLSSCSTDDTNVSNKDILGVWERLEIINNETTLLRLVFGDANRAIKIERTNFDDGTEISSANSYEWLLNENEVILTGENTATLIFELNSSADPMQLENGTDSPIIKVSDDFGDFFQN